jgi:FkbM family methyltransferase
MSPQVNFQSDADVIWEAMTKVSGRLAFDIGANGGLTATMLAERFDTVIAVEPCKESYDALVGYVPPNVSCFPFAVSDTEGEIKLRETTLTGRFGELFTDDTLPWGDHVGYREIDCTTLDTMSERLGWPDFLKIDTEGHEVQVLLGGPQTFLRDPAFIIEVHSREKGAEVQRMLEAIGLPFAIHYHQAYREMSPHRLGHYWVTSPPERLGA